MSVKPRPRTAPRAAFRWLSRLASTVRRATGQPDSTTVEDGISWPIFDRLQFVVPNRNRAGVGGEHRSRMRAPSPDFADYRPYQHGDDIRRIDWNVYGRLGALQVRQTEALVRVPVTILLDCSASMHWGEPDKFKFSTDLASALARIALARSDTVTVECLGPHPQTIGPIAGIRQFGVIEQRLGEISPAGRIDLAETVRRHVERDVVSRGPRGMFFLISDLLNVSNADALFDTLRESTLNPVVLHVLSPEEAEPEALGDVDLVDAETGQIVEVGLSVDTIRQYRERYEAWRAGLERQCHDRDIRYIRCSTARTVPEVVLADLRTGQVVR